MNKLFENHPSIDEEPLAAVVPRAIKLPSGIVSIKNAPISDPYAELVKSGPLQDLRSPEDMPVYHPETGGFRARNSHGEAGAAHRAARNFDSLNNSR